MLLKFTGTMLAVGEYDRLRLELTHDTVNDILRKYADKNIIHIKIKKHIDYWKDFAEKNRGALCEGECTERQFVFKQKKGITLDLFTIKKIEQI
jgi:hypothetical protein